MFFTSQLSATLHPKIKPSKPNICLKEPSWTSQEGPRRAQGSPRWAQGGPKEGRHTTGKSGKIILEALLGPSWAASALQKLWYLLGVLLFSNSPGHLISSCFQDARCLNHVQVNLSMAFPCSTKFGANLTSKLLSASLQVHKKSSKERLGKLSEGSLPPEFGQKRLFSVVFRCF